MSTQTKNPAHILLEKHLAELGLEFECEFRFHDKRKWRLDYAIKATQPYAVEIEGAIWTRGRHTRGKGYQADLDKYNAAVAMGYKIFRFSTEDVLRGRARAFLKEHLCAGGGKCASASLSCIGYPKCDGDLPGEKHSPECPLEHVKKVKEEAAKKMKVAREEQRNGRG